jgi:hypothetical protein
LSLPTSARLLPRSLLTPPLLGCAGPAKNAIRQIAHGRFPKFPGGAPGAFFATKAIIAEQTRDGVATAKKMDLKAVSLFLGAWFRIDAPDILLRIGISSFFHRVSL